MAEEAAPLGCDCGGRGTRCLGASDCEGEREDGAPREREWRWLESTVALQREAFGFEWGEAPDEASVAASLKDNVFAALVELGESTREFSWKYWATDQPFVHRARLLGEVVDVAHFIANMLVAMKVTDKEWEEAYRAKQEVNRQRMASGTYSAQKESS